MLGQRKVQVAVESSEATQVSAIKSFFSVLTPN